ncbi:MAG TPA: hypothetical protein VK467_12320, partial [Gemmatimonadales bacterium]|nr:hypothetical protein [Gemmatimonadales bacterium]
MSREVLFGMGNLAERMAALVGEDASQETVEAAPDASTAYVHVGQLFTSPAACTVTTILGSCVSVCVWDPTTGAGGL